MHLRAKGRENFNIKMHVSYFEKISNKMLFFFMRIRCELVKLVLESQIKVWNWLKSTHIILHELQVIFILNQPS